MPSKTQINEVASYLRYYDRALYDRLSSDVTVAKESLDETEILGSASDPNERSDAALPVMNRAILLSDCKVIGAALISSRVKANIRAESLRGQLTKIRRWRYYSAAFTAGSAAIASVSAMKDGGFVTVMASLATLASTLANTAVSTFVLGKSGTEEEVLRLIRDLSETLTYSSVSVAYLAAVEKGDYPVEQSAALATEANKHFGKLMMALSNSEKYVTDLSGEEDDRLRATTQRTAGQA